MKKDNFSLKLKLHFYEQRLEKMAPSSVEQALRENIQLKVEFQTLRTELKRYKKLLLDGDKAIQALTAERDQFLAADSGARRGGGAVAQSAREKDFERRLLEQEEQREQWERKARELHSQNKQLRADGASTEVSLESHSFRGLHSLIPLPLCRIFDASSRTRKRKPTC